jgi:hypothetical protein
LPDRECPLGANSDMIGSQSVLLFVLGIEAVAAAALRFGVSPLLVNHE